MVCHIPLMTASLPAHPCIMFRHVYYQSTQASARTWSRPCTGWWCISPWIRQGRERRCSRPSGPICCGGQVRLVAWFFRRSQDERRRTDEQIPFPGVTGRKKGRGHKTRVVAKTCDPWAYLSSKRPARVDGAEQDGHLADGGHPEEGGGRQGLFVVSSSLGLAVW